MTGVVRGPNGQGVAGVELRVLREATGQVLLTSKVGSGGRFELHGLPLAALRFQVNELPYRPESSTLQVEPASEPQRLTLDLELGQRITGRVVDPAGQPVASASVGSSDDKAGLVSSDVNGRFELTGLGSRPVNVFATAPGFAPLQRDQVAPGTRELTLTLQAPASLSGALTLSSVSQDLELALCRYDATHATELCVARAIYRAEDSRYSFSRIAPGDYQLVARVNGHELSRQPVRLAAGQAAAGPALSFRAD